CFRPALSRWHVRCGDDRVWIAQPVERRKWSRGTFEGREAGRLGGCARVFKTGECDASSVVQPVLQKSTAVDGWPHQWFAERLHLFAGIGLEVSGSVPTLAPDGAGRFRSGWIRKPDGRYSGLAHGQKAGMR